MMTSLHITFSLLMLPIGISTLLSQELSLDHDLEFQLPSLNTLSDKDPEIVSFLEQMMKSLLKMADEVSQMKTQKSLLQQMQIDNVQLKMDNMELRDSLEILKEEKGLVYQNITDMKKEVMECQRNLKELRRDKRGRNSGHVVAHPQRYTPSYDKSAPRNTVVASVNETALEQLLKLLAPATCYDWKIMGFDTSGYYLIDPDGKGIGDAPFTAYCDMYTGYSFVHHNHEDDRNVSSCGGVGCYQQEIEYQTSMTQMEALIDVSDSCQQMISIDCKDSPLSEDGVDYSWWTDRHGNSINYWAGDESETHTCNCGYTNVCVDPRKSCNCDSGVSGVWLHDYGYVSNSDVLPVTRVQFGSKDEQTPTEIHYKIGPLRCFGRREIKYPESCKDLRLSGVTHSGYHYIGTSESPKLVFCDMETDLEQSMKWQKPAVSFYVALINSVTKLDTVIFERVRMNVGNGYDPKTGIFTCTHPGLYYFTAFAWTDVNGWFELRKNDINFTFGHNNAGSWGITGLSFITELKKGDQIWIHLNRGTMHGYNANGDHSYFMGMLLNM